jgi:hypothetical protein
MPLGLRRRSVRTRRSKRTGTVSRLGGDEFASLASVRWHTDGGCACPYCRRQVFGKEGRFVMKWAGMYLVGFIVLIGGVLAALWKLGILQRVGTTCTLSGVAILLGIGIMISVANSGSKENVQIDRK